MEEIMNDFQNIGLGNLDVGDSILREKTLM